MFSFCRGDTGALPRDRCLYHLPRHRPRCHPYGQRITVFWSISMAFSTKTEHRQFKGKLADFSSLAGFLTKDWDPNWKVQPGKSNSFFRSCCYIHKATCMKGANHSFVPCFLRRCIWLLHFNLHFKKLSIAHKYCLQIFFITRHWT